MSACFGASIVRYVVSNGFNYPIIHAYSRQTAATADNSCYPNCLQAANFFSDEGKRKRRGDRNNVKDEPTYVEDVTRVRSVAVSVITNNAEKYASFASTDAKTMDLIKPQFI